MCLVVAVIVGLFWGAIVLLRLLYSQSVVLTAEMKNWDVVIIAALIAGAFSVVLTVMTKYFDYLLKKKDFIFQKRISTYERIVSFIFKFQNREGYTHSFNKDEIQSEYFALNQQILLWSSIPVQKKWNQYFVKSFNQDNYSYQQTIPELFYVITEEIGQKIKRESFYDNSLLFLLYDQTSFKLFLENESGIKGQIIRESSSRK